MLGWRSAAIMDASCATQVRAGSGVSASWVQQVGGGLTAG